MSYVASTPLLLLVSSCSSHPKSKLLLLLPVGIGKALYQATAFGSGCDPTAFSPIVDVPGTCRKNKLVPLLKLLLVPAHTYHVQSLSGP